MGVFNVQYIISVRLMVFWVIKRQEVSCFTELTFLDYDPFIPLACAECDVSLPFSGTFSIPLCYILCLATLLHQLFFHPLSLHPAIYFLDYLPILLFSNSFIIPFWEFYFLPFSVHAQINVIYLTLLSLL